METAESSVFVADKKDKKWFGLKHKGPKFAPSYERLPLHVRFKYGRETMILSEKAEEAAGFYAKLKKKKITDNLNKQFFREWKKYMTSEEKEKIVDFSECNFSELKRHYRDVGRVISTQDEYSYAHVQYQQGHEIVKEKIENFTMEAPGIFIGCGENPKSGLIKRRIQPEDVTINCSVQDIPTPPQMHQWGSTVENKKFTWLASWRDEINGGKKYMKFHPSSKIKMKSSKIIFDNALELKNEIQSIRKAYTKDIKSKDPKICQLAVALYFIDEFAFRIGMVVLIISLSFLRCYAYFQVMRKVQMKLTLWDVVLYVASMSNCLMTFLLSLILSENLLFRSKPPVKLSKESMKSCER
jgi:DNA topoisomerase I